MGQKPGQPCVGTREIDGVTERREWPSQADAAAFLGVARPTVCVAIGCGGTVAGWTMARMEQPRPERPQAMGGIVVQRPGEEPVRCFSLSDAAARLGSTRATVRKAIGSGRLVAGFWAWGAP